MLEGKETTLHFENREKNISTVEISQQIGKQMELVIKILLSLVLSISIYVHSLSIYLYSCCFCLNRSPTQKFYIARFTRIDIPPKNLHFPFMPPYTLQEGQDQKV